MKYGIRGTVSRPPDWFLNMSRNDKSVLMQIEGLSKYFPVRGSILSPKKVVKAVDRVSFSINEGETFVLMGESGCGKTTCALTSIRLLEPTDGDVLFESKKLDRKSVV